MAIPCRASTGLPPPPALLSHEIKAFRAGRGTRHSIFTESPYLPRLGAILPLYQRDASHPLCLSLGIAAGGLRAGSDASATALNFNSPLLLLKHCAFTAARSPSALAWGAGGVAFPARPQMLPVAPSLPPSSPGASVGFWGVGGELGQDSPSRDFSPRKVPL